MPTKAAERVMLDTNVLLAATDKGRGEHRNAMTVLNDWPGLGATLYASGQILREYLAVATRPVEQNGLGLSASDAVANARVIRDRIRFLAEDSRVSDQLLTLTHDVSCGGKQVHDANVVATMLVHGVEALVTSNVADFRGFADHVRIIDLPHLTPVALKDV